MDIINWVKSEWVELARWLLMITIFTYIIVINQDDNNTSL